MGILYGLSAGKRFNPDKSDETIMSWKTSAFQDIVVLCFVMP